MNSEFSYLYRQLSGISAHSADSPVSDSSDLMNIAELMDDSHIIVLNALVDELKKTGIRDKNTGQISVGPWDKIYEMFNKDLNYSISQVRSRLDEFTTVWRSRYSYDELFPQLRENRWIQQSNGWFGLSESGTAQAARTFYKQFLHDMITESLRILALFNGMLIRNQDKTAGYWQAEAAVENSMKLLPLLEESIRGKESEKLKTIREKLVLKFSDLFIKQFIRRENQYYRSEQELFRNIVGKWYVPQKYSSGLEGYMFFTADFIWQLINETGDLFHSKWRLFLSGINHSLPLEMLS